MNNDNKKFDAVFEGGGVKGVAFVGAISKLEEEGYSIERCAGTSAGAIISALLAVGYTSNEVKEIMLNTDYNNFLDKNISILSSGNILEKASHMYNLFTDKGFYSGDYFEKWIDNLLKAKSKTKFKDVCVNGKSKLKIIAADITNSTMLILPDDLKKYGIDPMEFEISKAVRMSMSIPFFFKPVELNNDRGTNFIVDGGILSNYPIWIFDTEGKPEYPTFGFNLDENELSYTAQGKTNFLYYSYDVMSTCIFSHNSEENYIRDKDLVRTIDIPTLGVSTTDFNISREKSLALYQSGYDSTANFLKEWDFEKYVNNYRDVA
ncbi:patatin-like phospholipase family protein [uncultured Clostridium sp.]|uniref:patatin-like phospholipase family protein n=1 Tax=uncultured Clostridium sp. TaxID=59620 RepID=UPI0028E7B0AF|nr:patatin-like phospholipase family protein [uncultured Clostridium sp.]